MSKMKLLILLWADYGKSILLMHSQNNKVSANHATHGIQRECACVSVFLFAVKTSPD